ncbi:MAG TPA: hypothetical protein VLS89_14230 [Candidatus Nanopelagicales bacterium]|nr:hypothetical protein [Candidatus Nanopelagicales bacterium]
MKPALLLNHALLDGLAHRADEGDEAARAAARRPVVEIADTMQRARRVRREQAVLFVHPDLGMTEVAADQPFVIWANQQRRNPVWGNALDLLLQLLSGPFVTSMAVDDGPRPIDTVPSCLEVPEWLVEMLLTAAHHGLACGRSSWILSYGPVPHLDQPIYRATRESIAAEIKNLRTDGEAREAEAALSRADAKTTLAVLEAAALHTERVRVLDSARSSAKRWEIDCRPEVLFEAIRGLDAFARALDEGLPRDTAAERYRLACGVEMSQEKAQTLKKPSLREQRRFLIPGDTDKRLFDMHAKPGEQTRVHVLARKEPKDEQDADRGEHTLVYVGHCGEHLPLR